MQATANKFVVRATKLLSAVLVTGVGAAFTGVGPGPFGSSFQASVVGTGAVTATVDIEVSNDGTYWKALGTITLSGTTNNTDFLVLDKIAPYAQIRGNVTAVSGTGAAVTLTIADYIPTTTGQA